MAIQINGILFDELSSDPGSPAEGQVWFNSTSFQLKLYRNAAIVVLIDKVAFDLHANSTTNPHTTTLELARSAGSTLAGSFSMGSFAITNLGAGSVGTDAAQRQWVSDQITARLAGMDWQESVLSRLGTPPGGPITGDRHLVSALTGAITAVNTGTKTFTVTGDHSALVASDTFTVSGSTGNDGTYTVVSATFTSSTAIIVSEVVPDGTGDGQINYAVGAWNGSVNDIAEYNGATWDLFTPNEGWTTRVEDENVIYTFDGTNWGNIGGAVDHGSLLGLADDDHLQYLNRSGVRAMTGGLDMGTNAITNVGLVDGVDVSGHAARHNPGSGLDELSTAAPGSTGVATASAVGTATSFARSDHAHQSNTAPSAVTKAAAAIGTSGEPARADHKHDVSTAAPAAAGVGTTSGEGAATTLARSDHSHQSNTAPVAVTKAAAAIGTSTEPARADHKHDASTAAPAAAGLGTTSGEGAATTLARSDHTHQSNTAPANVTKAAAVIGTSTEPARADHKHDVSTAAASEITDSTNSEGSATSLARSDHGHAHGNRGGGSLHAQTSASGDGFQPQSNRVAVTDPTINEDSGDGYAVGSYWINTSSDNAFVCLDATVGAAVWKNTTNAASGSLVHKAGQVASGSFAGNPKKATVTFSTPFSDAVYGVTVTARTQNDKTFAPVVESQLAGSFVINMGTNNITDLLGANWVAMKTGEST